MSRPRKYTGDNLSQVLDDLAAPSSLTAKAVDGQTLPVLALEDSTGATLLSVSPDTGLVSGPGMLGSQDAGATYGGSLVLEGGSDDTAPNILGGSVFIGGGMGQGSGDGGNIQLTAGVPGNGGDPGQILLLDFEGNVMLSVGPAANTLAFFNGTATTVPTVTGSRGGNAALASLLTALANYGLITNSTTA